MHGIRKRSNWWHTLICWIVLIYKFVKIYRGLYYGNNWFYSSSYSCVLLCGSVVTLFCDKYRYYFLSGQLQLIYPNLYISRANWVCTLRNESQVDTWQSMQTFNSWCVASVRCRTTDISNNESTQYLWPKCVILLITIAVNIIWKRFP